MSNQSLDLSRGFLPNQDPLKKLPTAFQVWEDTAENLRKLLVGDQFRKHLENLPEFPVARLQTPAEYERAMLILSFLGHAYVWGCSPIATKIPQVLAKPWCAVAQVLGRPPILSYASYALQNWYRLDTKRPVELGNIVLAQNFLGGIDEEWFVLVHVNIEAVAALALQALLPAQQAAANKEPGKLLTLLQQIIKSLQTICQILDRMPEHCDPYIYFNRVRPYIHGWKEHPTVLNGMIYEDCYANQPQYFRGETGAQSSIIPALDRALGITHQQDELSIYLKEMLDYTPPAHRVFLTQLENNPSVREYIMQHHPQLPALRDAYNQCIDLLVRFRMTHLRYAALYIHKQSQHSSANPTEVGTGGTPFMRYLKKHEEETLLFKI